MRRALTGKKSVRRESSKTENSYLEVDIDMNEAFVVVGIILALVLLYIGLTYSQYMSLRNRVRTQNARIDVQLKKRYELIPNLIRVIRKYVSGENDAIEEVTRARLIAMGRNDIGDKSRDNERLKEGLNNLFEVCQNYAELNEDDKYSDLQGQIKETEVKIEKARQLYNETVIKYNKAIEPFPGNIIAKIMGFNKARLFDFEVSEEEGLGFAIKIL